MSASGLGLLACLIVTRPLGGCGDNDNPCNALKDELRARIEAANPDLRTPTEVYNQDYRDLVARIRDRGCSLPELGERPLLCYLGEPAEACPPGYDCHPDVHEVCVRR